MASVRYERAVFAGHELFTLLTIVSSHLADYTDTVIQVTSNVSTPLPLPRRMAGQQVRSAVHETVSASWYFPRALIVREAFDVRPLTQNHQRGSHFANTFRFPT